jgi:hypothetical protein
MDNNNNNNSSISIEIESLVVELLLSIFYWIPDFTTWRNLSMTCKKFHQILTEEYKRRLIQISKIVPFFGGNSGQFVILPCGRGCTKKVPVAIETEKDLPPPVHIHFNLINKCLDGIVVTYNNSYPMTIETIFTGRYSNGIRDGLFTTIKSNEKILEANYVEGLLEGTFFYQYDGSSIVKCEMQHDLFHGECNIIERSMNCETHIKYHCSHGDIMSLISLKKIINGRIARREYFSGSGVKIYAQCNHIAFVPEPYSSAYRFLPLMSSQKPILPNDAIL